MNRCYWCNKFRRWSDLVATYLDEPGSPVLEPKDILVCRKGTGCNRREYP